MKDELRYYLLEYLHMKGIDTRGSFRCLSPRHDDSNPSMRYYDLKKRVKCFACGASYDLFDLVGIDYGLESFSAQIEEVEKLFCFSTGSLPPLGKACTGFPSAPKKPRTVTRELWEAGRIYSAMLGMLPLYPRHYNNLRYRGLTGAEIVTNKYCSIPDGPRNWIADKLIPMGYSLEGIPGFYFENGWKVFLPYSGFFIPVNDIEGKLKLLLIRRDGNPKNKYVWFASTRKEDFKGYRLCYG